MRSSRTVTFPSTGEDKAVLKSTVAVAMLIFLAIRGAHPPPHERGFAGVGIFSHPSLLGPVECRTLIRPTLDVK